MPDETDFKIISNDKKKLVVFIGAQRSGKTAMMADLIKYGVPDSFGDVHMPGCFDGSLKNHLAQKRFDAMNNKK